MQVIVVGAGIAGLSTAWSLTRRGHQVTLLEQGCIPNPLAASGDHHRIIRRAYGKASGYGRAITEAYRAWDELWSDLGESHHDPRGFLCMSREAGDEAEQYREGLEEGGYPFELLTGAGRSRALAVPRSRHVPLRLPSRRRAGRCTAARSPRASPAGCAATARRSTKTARSWRSSPTRPRSSLPAARRCRPTSSSSPPAPGC